MSQPTPGRARRRSRRLAIEGVRPLEDRQLLTPVLNPIDPGAPPGNGALPATGLLNWYDIGFDPEGYFDGKPSMFVSSVSTTDPNKNVVYRIGPDGSFMGLYIKFGSSATSPT